MRRSEMLKILQDSFIYHMNPTGPANTDEEMFSNILKDLEEAGMCPPHAEGLEDPIWDGYGTDDYNPCHKNHLSGCKWEFEDA